MTDRLPARLEERVHTVEAASASDPGLTPIDWLSLILTAVAVPGLVLWIGWGH
jgi:hypothetical protein